MRHTKFPIWATIFTVMGIVILCSLGTWQIYRLEWKTDLLAKIESEYAKDARTTIITSDQLKKAQEERTPFLRGTLKGIFDYKNEILVGPRSVKGNFIYDVITPLALNDGKIILVNRGWVDEKHHNPSQIHQGQYGQPERVTGVIRSPASTHPLYRFSMPSNDPEKNVWYYLNIPEVAEKNNLTNVLPLEMVAENLPYETDDWPKITGNSKPELRNNHLQYAVFWFSMAGILAGVYVLRFRKPHSSPEP